MNSADTINPDCILCKSGADLFYKNASARYYKCRNCLSVFMDPDYFPSPEEEKKRYELHNNDVNDIKYQEFVMPIVDEICGNFEICHTGLDFGAGTGPVISKLLKDRGYQIELYDPYFWPNHEKLQLQYDFIVCCEVIEHFHNPAKEFKLLKSLLKKDGMLCCMTEIYPEAIDFHNWYYKNDPTHVFFYHRKALEWIKKNYKFKVLKIKGRLVSLER